MRYKVVVRRVQAAERHVRAADEEAAALKVQAELERPYGFLGGWQTIDTDLDVAEAENPLSGPPAQFTDAKGSLLLSVKAAATHLGVPNGSMYQLINSGVETQDQYDHLKRLGCTVAQGYLLHRPAPPEIIHGLLGAQAKSVGAQTPRRGSRGHPIPAR